MQIFVSSTCFDLVDLRAELNVFFREAGTSALLSDNADSEFVVHTDMNSIETCLANVRSCDHFVIILSNRYGPSLAKAGFPDVSATHLEYLEARKSGKPVHMYVRDRLAADHAIWRKNNRRLDLELSWCKEPNDRRLLELLEQHRELSAASPVGNWFWTFRDSVDLKQQLTREFSSVFAKATALKLAQAGRVPLLEVAGKITGYHNERVSFEMTIRNLSVATAVSPELAIKDATDKWRMPSLMSAQTHKFTAAWHYPGWQIVLQSILTYRILEGYGVREEGTLTFRFDPRNLTTATIAYDVTRRDFVENAGDLFSF